MAGRVRSHRRPAGTAVVVVVMLFMCTVAVCLRLGLHLVVGAAYRALGFPLTIGLAVLAGLLFLFGKWAWQIIARRMVGRWVRQARWSLVTDRTLWPWTPLQMAPDMVTVDVAFTGEAGGYPVTIGEVAWTGNGLGDAVDRWTGRGVFAVVQLPHALPPSAVRLRRTVHRRRSGEDEFRRRYRVIVEDPVFARRLADSRLRRAHLRRDIPPWTIVGSELVTITSSHGPLTPRKLKLATRQALRIIQLLGLDVDVSVRDAG
jgi:hypothetical protein